MEKILTYKPARGTCVGREETGGAVSHSKTNQPIGMRKGSATVQPRKERLLCSLMGLWPSESKQDTNPERRLSSRQAKGIRRAAFCSPKGYETARHAR